jgi:two-component system, OmpR family, sensor histidine kinase BaeS
MLLTADSRLLAASVPVDPDLIGAPLIFPGLNQVLDGKTVRLIHYAPDRNEEAIDIFTPVVTPDRQVVGIVRMTYRAGIFYEEFGQFRGLIALTLVLSLLLATALGSLLAWNINRPIQRATRQIYQLAHGELRVPQTEYGPEEVRLLMRATNYLVEQLNNMEQSRRQMLANLVHELGRPLGALRSAIQAIAKGAGKDPEFLAELTQGMDQETLRLQRLVEDLAQLHEQSLGVLEINRQPLALSEWLPGVLPPWRQSAAEKHLHWNDQVPTDLPEIMADPQRLAQVLGNLISNAIKYTPIGGTVTLTAGADTGTVWVRVSDTGPGIPAEEQEKVFSPYYRGQQGRRIRQGMGLGLSIARDLVSAHGGRLEVESIPGLGSHFTMRLPQDLPQQAPQAPAE